MEWMDWKGKHIFVQLKSGGYYTGKVIDIEESSPIIFFTLIDKFGKKIIFIQSEIVKIVEEEKENEYMDKKM